MGRIAGCKVFLFGAALLAGSQVSSATLTVVISDVRSDIGVLNIGIYDNKNDWLGSSTVQKRGLTGAENIAWVAWLRQALTLNPENMRSRFIMMITITARWTPTLSVYPRSPRACPTVRCRSLGPQSIKMPRFVWETKAWKCRLNCSTRLWSSSTALLACWEPTAAFAIAAAFSCVMRH